MSESDPGGVPVNLFEGLATETRQALRGSLALVRGDRGAAGYFDLSLRGWAGSMAAFVLATGLDALLTAGTSETGLLGWQSLFLSLVLWALQVGFTAVVLNQIQRLDAFVPYLVADNWITFFLSLLLVTLSVANAANMVVLVIVWVVALVARINTARFIMTLTVMQIVLVLVAQLVAAAIGIYVLALVVPGV